MNKPINTIVRKWEQSGLLGGLSTTRKTSCAVSLEDLAQVLVENIDKLNEVYGAKGAETINCTLIPIMRRLYGEEINTIPSAKELFEDYVSTVASDPETALCDLYIKDFVNRKNK